MTEVRAVSAIDEAATRLTSARVSGSPCPPVRSLLPPDDLDAAYSVQSTCAVRRRTAGAEVIGRKIGLTHPRVQAQLGVDQPDFGVLFDDMACAAGESVAVDRLLQPKIEAEIAFVLEHDLDHEPIGPREVVSATNYITVAFEIVDSRIANWDITIVDTIADNASSGLFVLGVDQRPLDGFDLSECAMSMTRNGEVVSTGSGAQCLSNPVHAVVWLARKAIAYGNPLRAGDVVLSGALGPMVVVSPGDVFDAAVTGFESIQVGFTQGRKR